MEASWEPDLWGRIRSQVASAVQNAQATAADVENARLSLHAELALDYFDLRNLDEERRILENAVAAYQKAFELTKNRYDGGAANRAEVAEARTQLEATGAQAVDVTDLRAQYQHAIAVLTGRPPEGFAIAGKAGGIAVPVTPPCVAFRAARAEAGYRRLRTARGRREQPNRLRPRGILSASAARRRDGIWKAAASATG